jgi:hypothetical protein
MAACVLCQRSVVADPETLSDGRLVHAGCKAQLTRVPRRKANAAKVDVVRADEGLGPAPEPAKLGPTSER